MPYDLRYPRDEIRAGVVAFRYRADVFFLEKEAREKLLSSFYSSKNREERMKKGWFLFDRDHHMFMINDNVDYAKNSEENMATMNFVHLAEKRLSQACSRQFAPRMGGVARNNFSVDGN